MSYVPYASVVGSFIYGMVWTKLSIVHVVGNLSRYVSKCTSINWLWYLFAIGRMITVTRSTQCMILRHVVIILLDFAGMFSQSTNTTLQRNGLDCLMHTFDTYVAHCTNYFHICHSRRAGKHCRRAGIQVFAYVVDHDSEWWWHHSKLHFFLPNCDAAYPA